MTDKETQDENPILDKPSQAEGDDSDSLSVDTPLENENELDSDQ